MHLTLPWSSLFSACLLVNSQSLCLPCPRWCHGLAYDEQEKHQTERIRVSITASSPTEDSIGLLSRQQSFIFAATQFFPKIPVLTKKRHQLCFLCCTPFLNSVATTKGDIEYLIHWVNSATGEQYSPAWKPQANVHPLLKADWLAKLQGLPVKNRIASTARHETLQPRQTNQKIQRQKRPIVLSASSTPVLSAVTVRESEEPLQSSPCARLSHPHSSRSSFCATAKIP